MDGLQTFKESIWQPLEATDGSQKLRAELEDSPWNRTVDSGPKGRAPSLYNYVFSNPALGEHREEGKTTSPSLESAVDTFSHRRPPQGTKLNFSFFCGPPPPSPPKFNVASAVFQQPSEKSKKMPTVRQH